MNLLDEAYREYQEIIHTPIIVDDETLEYEGTTEVVGKIVSLFDDAMVERSIETREETIITLVDVLKTVEQREIFAYYTNPYNWGDVFSVDVILATSTKIGARQKNMESKIANALKVLEEFNTPEYKCLKRHGFTEEGFGKGVPVVGYKNEYVGDGYTLPPTDKGVISNHWSRMKERLIEEGVSPKNSALVVRVGQDAHIHTYEG